ncbi:MAG: AMP-binding protein, partial [Oscillospiraceae bacterium]
MKNRKMKSRSSQLVEKRINGTVQTIYDAPFHNLYDTLAATESKFANKIGLVDDKEKITYAEFKHRVDITAYYLSTELHVQQGESVAMMFVNSIDFCVVFYALAKLGCVAVTINTKLQSEEIIYILQDTKVKILFMNSIWWNKVSRIIDDSFIKQIIFDKTFAAEDC